MQDLIKACHKHRVRLIVCGLAHQPLDIAKRSGLLKRFSTEGSADLLVPDLASGLAAATASL